MRYLTLALVAICGFYFPSARQIKDKPEPPDQEIVRLRQLLNIPPEKPIKFSLSKELPNENPFKVYGLVVSRLDLNDSQQATKTWVENWNKKNANKYGALEAATNISEADLIFLWLVYPEEAISSALSQLGYNPVARITSYLIVQNSTEARIVWKFKAMGADYNFSAAADKEFKERMKARAKALKK